MEAGNVFEKSLKTRVVAGSIPTKKEERFYVAGYELYKKHSGANAGLERVSLSLMDEGHRFVMIETRNDVDDGTEKQLTRYQLHNHLGSAALELNNDAIVISYEEYHPYGTTAYQAKNRDIKSAAKQYRYTGMERDEETGLEYHSARYYLPWLGRWCSCDPIGIRDGVNQYRFVNNCPIKFIDQSGLQSDKASLKRASENVKRSIQKQAKKLGLGLADIDHLVPESVLVRKALDANLSKKQFKNLLKGTPELWALIDEKINRARQAMRYSEWLDKPLTKSKKSVHEVRANISSKDAKKLRSIENKAFNAIDENIKRAGSLKEFKPKELAAMAKKSAVLPTRPLNKPEKELLHKRNKVAGKNANKKIRIVKRSPKVPKIKAGLFSLVIAIGVFAWTGDAYAAAQTANPLAESTDAHFRNEGTRGRLKATFLDVVNIGTFGLVPLMIDAQIERAKRGRNFNVRGLMFGGAKM